MDSRLMFFDCLLNAASYPSYAAASVQSLRTDWILSQTCFTSVVLVTAETDQKVMH